MYYGTYSEADTHKEDERRSPASGGGTDPFRFRKDTSFQRIRSFQHIVCTNWVLGCKRNIPQMNPVKRFGSKVAERNGDCLKMWQRHLESKTQRQAGAKAPKIEQGLVEDVAKRHFESKTQRQAGAEGPNIEQGWH